MKILIRYKNTNDWVFSINIPLEPIIEEDFGFETFEYQINGKVFSEWSDEMEKTIKDARFWDKLTDD